MSKLKYEIREGTDLKWGIYSTEYNIRIAEFYPNTEADRKQIREMIQKPGRLPEKRPLTVDEIISKYPESVRFLLNELVQKLDALQKKPEVTEEFIRKWADVIHQADTGLFGIKGELKLVRQMFKEAGVEISVA